MKFVITAHSFFCHLCDIFALTFELKPTDISGLFNVMSLLKSQQNIFKK